MPKEWYLMDTNTYFSGTENDEFENYAQSGFNELLKISPEARNVLINNVPKRVIIQNVTTESIKYITIRYMLSHIGDSESGYYVKFDDKIWLVLAKPDNNKMYEKSVIQECNHNLKWINDNNKLIIKPCIVSSKTLYTPGMKNEKEIVIPDGMMGIQLPYDDDTNKLNRGNCFVFNKSKYKVTFYDEVTHPGLIVLICAEESRINTNYDDMKNEIVDRWDKNGNDRLGGMIDRPDESEIPDEESIVTYEIKGLDTLRSIQNDIYIVHKYVNGEEVEGNFEFEISDELLATIVEITNNTCKVQANWDDNTGIVTLIATDKENGEVTTKDIEIKAFF